MSIGSTQNATGSTRRWSLAVPLISICVAVAVLAGEGRRWWCACGSFVPWSWNIHSAHNSQHLIDPYTITHVLHGVLFYAVFSWLPAWVSTSRRFALTVFLEACWEVLENSPLIIERYRSATIALGYVGDSVLNSLSDILACAFGFWLASRFPAKWTVALVVASELLMLIFYRDNLALNIVMLIRPFPSLRDWQMGLSR